MHSIHLACHIPILLAYISDYNQSPDLLSKIYGTNMFDVTDFAQKSNEIIQAGNFLYSQGWSPATSSNYSARLNDQCIAITVSGKHKGKLGHNDIMVVDLQGNAVQRTDKASAETLLHTSLYSLFPKTGAVLHTHSIGATVLSRYLDKQAALILRDYELQKAIAGQTTHNSELVIPIFENTQDISDLAQKTRHYFKQTPHVPAYLIRGHGLYTWGENMNECLRHIEALEFMIQCEINMIRINK